MSPTTGFMGPTDIGGPKDVGQEYRWNVPVLTYTFDQSFLEYFGTDGVAAVESAISILNNLPPASQIDPATYPADVTRINWRAQAEGLFDLKSQALALLLEQMGLGSPTRFAWCVHSYSMVNDQPQVTVIQRNFDPFTFAPTNRVNDTLYTYFLAFGDSGSSVDAVELTIDPLSQLNPAVADAALSFGSLYTGLSRDDVGGLRYLLQTNNLNYEPLLPDVQGAGTNAGSWQNFAVRAGVDKLAFVRSPALDPLLGQFFVPYTNQYIDTFVLQNAFQQQMLERVSTVPDIVFSAADLGDGTSPGPRVTRTGTTDWILGQPMPGASGPGIIKPPIRFTFNKPMFRLQTCDDLAGADVTIQYFEDYRWGSFDVSTNPPVAFPADAVPAATNEFSVSLSLRFANSDTQNKYNWQLPVTVGGAASIETSTNLTDWTSVLTITNRGSPLTWNHTVGHPQRYFRVVAQ